jgi:hypothetical protein
LMHTGGAALNLVLRAGLPLMPKQDSSEAATDDAGAGVEEVVLVVDDAEVVLVVVVDPLVATLVGLEPPVMLSTAITTPIPTASTPKM